MKIIILTFVLLIKSILIIETSSTNYDMDSLISKSYTVALQEAKYNDAIHKAAEHYNIDNELARYIYDICYGIELDYYIFLELIYTESRFDSQAISSSDARGYCQIKNIVVRDVELNLDRNIPSENILIGAYYLKSLLTDYGFGMREALIFYNTGSRDDLRASGERYANKILKNRMDI